MFAFFLVFALAFQLPQENPKRDEQIRAAQQKASEYRQQALQLNDLAGHIRSEDDAQKFVDALAKMFEDELPPAWATSGVRRRVAHAEYESATDRTRLVPEQRIADVWNEYVREIGAPEEARVTAEEIHNLRDAEYAFGQMLWTSDTNRSVWTIPNVVAVGLDGKVANGCRATEAVRVIFEMDHMFDNVRSARERVRKGILLSDEIKHRPKTSMQPGKSFVSVRVTSDTDPMRLAEQRYMAEHGAARFDFLLTRLFEQLFPQ
jgi:hypothetical protein